MCNCLNLPQAVVSNSKIIAEHPRITKTVLEYWCPFIWRSSTSSPLFFRSPVNKQVISFSVDSLGDLRTFGFLKSSHRYRRNDRLFFHQVFHRIRHLIQVAFVFLKVKKNSTSSSSLILFLKFNSGITTALHLKHKRFPGTNLNKPLT